MSDFSFFLLKDLPNNFVDFCLPKRSAACFDGKLLGMFVLDLISCIVVSDAICSLLCHFHFCVQLCIFFVLRCY